MVAERKPSAYQRRIYEFVASGLGHGVIRATAGSGKTTTLIEIARRLPEDLQVCFLAFSKDAARELRRRLPDGIDARTVHAAGFRTMATYLNRGRARLMLDDAKYARLIGAELARHAPRGGIIAELEADERAQLATFLHELLTFTRLERVDAQRSAWLRELATRRQLRCPGPGEVMDYALNAIPRLLQEGARIALATGRCDFDDLLFLPLVHVERVPGLRPRQYDLVFVDEAQDYSRLALDFTMALVRPRGRMLFVGDPQQSIFGFAGADPGAIDRIVAATGATLLPLSVSYRCPRTHVRLARHLSEDIEAAPGAIAGRVLTVPDPMLERTTQAGALVLSRTNAPLIGVCRRLVGAGLRVRLRGQDLAEALEVLAEEVYGGAARVALAAAIETYRRAAAARLVESVADVHTRREQMGRVLDLTGCLEAAARPLVRRGSVSLSPLRGAIASRFAAPTADAVVCSTVHRAKGQEAEQVLLVHPETLPAADSHTRDDILGEGCVMFVALTRSKHELVFVRQPRRDRTALLATRYLERVQA